MAAALPMRKLAAIMAADVVGFSRQMGADETGTLHRLSLAREDVIDPLIAAHYGRIFKVMGDGILAEFPSAVLALRCAVEIQIRLDAENAPRPAEARIVLRIGLHQGDVVVEGTDLLGDGVNVAARLEPMAEPGGICVSHRVHEDAAGKLVLAFEDLGERNLKNIFNPVRVHRVRLAMQTVHEAPPDAAPRAPVRPVIAVLPFDLLGGVAEAHAHIATGLAEDIITALSRLRFLSVVPRAASFSQGAGGDLRRVARDLGARYLVTGSVRQSGDRVRVSAQVIDATSGEQLWADRHESRLAEVFDIQDRIALLVSAAVGAMVSPGGNAMGDGPEGDGQETVLRRPGLVHSVTVSGVEPPRRMTIGSAPLTVGRMLPSHILLAGNEVSRAHCRLALVGAEVVVTDLGSTNGTFVDGDRIAAPVVLVHGATIRIGPHVLIYECSATDRDATGIRAQAAAAADRRDSTFRN